MPSREGFEVRRKGKACYPELNVQFNKKNLLRREGRKEEDRASVFSSHKQKPVKFEGN